MVRQMFARFRIGPIFLAAIFISTSALAVPQDVEDTAESGMAEIPPEESVQPPEVDSDAADKPKGMDPILTGLLQVLAGTAVSSVGAPLSLMTCGLYGCLLEPAVVAYAETWAGDYFGQKRGAAIYPIAAQYAFGVAAFATNLALNLMLPVTTPTTTDLTQVVSGYAKQPNFWIKIGTSTAISAVGVAVIPVVYNLTADDKLPGDTGSGLPGVYTPAHPKVTAGAPVPLPAEAETAMAW